MNTKAFCLKTASFGLIGGLVLSAFASVGSFAASGSVHITNEMVSGSKPVLKSSVNVGGGVWDYGTGLTEFGTKKECWSNYNHPSRKHSSTAYVGTQRGYGEAEAGGTSYASARGGLFDETHAYWNDTVN